MKNVLQGALIAMTLFTVACKDAPKADKAETTEELAVQSNTARGKQYKVNGVNSTVQWTGTKPTGHHHGNFPVKEGTLSMADNSILGGTIVMDVSGLTAFDDDGSANGKLQGHLKSADFFDADKYPTASFEIMQVTAIGDNRDLVMKDATHNVTGNLKIKDVVKSITFPAKINVADGIVTADAEFNMNRTLWGINYHSDKSLGDKFINQDVNIKLHVEATNKEVVALR